MLNIIVDAHCDTISELLDQDCQLNKNNLHIDLERMSKVGNYIQFFATFINVKKIEMNPLSYIMKLIDKIYEQSQIYKDQIEIAYCYEDIDRIIQKNKTAGIISIEGGEALEGSLANLRMLYRLGVRSICLTWNYKNEIACGVGEEIDTGLTEFGMDVINEMNNLGMIIDVSHLGELGFWHVMNHSKMPVIASHSNAKMICPHKRNLTDEQIIALAKNNGVMGINFYPHFLSDYESASISDIIKHIEYIAGLVGTKHVGFGSDFDGIDITPEGVEDVSSISNIINELAKLNYTENQIDEIIGGNFLRLIKQVII